MGDTEHEPGTIRMKILHQDEYWIDRFGVERRLDEMPERHLRGVLDLLERKASRLFDLELVADLLRAPGCSWASDYDGYCSPLDQWPSPEVWLDQTALVSTIRARLAELSQRPVIAPDTEATASVSEELLAQLRQLAAELIEEKDPAYKDGWERGHDAGEQSAGRKLRLLLVEAGVA